MSTPASSRVLIIAGMHRSATSLAARVLHEAGLHIGREMMPPGRGNPHGHFEDVEFQNLLERMIAAAGRTPFTADADLSGQLGPGLKQEAAALVRSRGEHPLWGFKNPRACLFLGLWNDLLPEAQYLFLYRHPVDVALSLLRRAFGRELMADPWLTIRSWEVHNRLLLAFRERHPERCFLAHVSAVTADLSAFVRRLAARLGLALEDADLDRFYFPDDLMPAPAKRAVAWEALVPETMRLYARLEATADLPAVAFDRDDPRAAISRREREQFHLTERLFHQLLGALRARAEELEREAATPARTEARARAWPDLLSSLRLRRHS